MHIHLSIGILYVGGASLNNSEHYYMFGTIYHDCMCVFQLLHTCIACAMAIIVCVCMIYIPYIDHVTVIQVISCHNFPCLEVKLMLRMYLKHVCLQ